jgi:hypothetical protein
MKPQRLPLTGAGISLPRQAGADATSNETSKTEVPPTNSEQDEVKIPVERRFQMIPTPRSSATVVALTTRSVPHKMEKRTESPKTHTLLEPMAQEKEPRRRLNPKSLPRTKLFVRPESVQRKLARTINAHKMYWYLRS